MVLFILKDIYIYLHWYCFVFIAHLVVCRVDSGHFRSLRSNMELTSYEAFTHTSTPWTTSLLLWLAFVGVITHIWATWQMIRLASTWFRELGERALCWTLYLAHRLLHWMFPRIPREAEEEATHPRQMGRSSGRRETARPSTAPSAASSNTRGLEELVWRRLQSRREGA